MKQHQVYQYSYYMRRKGENREKGVDNLFEEIIAEISHRMEKETDIKFRKYRNFQTKLSKDVQTKTHCN